MGKYLILLFVILYSCNQNVKKANSEMEENICKDSTTVEVPNEKAKGEIRNIYIGCGYNYKLGRSSLDLFMPNHREIEQIKSILDFTGIPMNFEVYSANIDNAVATIVNGKRYIIYDPNLFGYVDNLSESYWSSMSIIAHEIGHHLSGHTLNNENDNGYVCELEADKFSGFILFKMGASLEQAKNAILNLGSESDSETHPSKYRRIKAIEEGWSSANMQRYESAIPPPPSNDKETFYKDEFALEDLISEDIIDHYTDKIYNKYEGIIIDVENNDPSGVSPDPYHNKVIAIELTKIIHEEYEPYKTVGKRVKFHLVNYYQMCRADLGNLEALMVPGRKIRFYSFYMGYGGEDFVYIKKLNR